MNQNPPNKMARSPRPNNTGSARENVVLLGLGEAWRSAWELGRIPL